MAQLLLRGSYLTRSKAHFLKKKFNCKDADMLHPQLQKCHKIPTCDAKKLFLKGKRRVESKTHRELIARKLRRTIKGFQQLSASKEQSDFNCPKEWFGKSFDRDDLSVQPIKKYLPKEFGIKLNSCDSQSLLYSYKPQDEKLKAILMRREKSNKLESGKQSTTIVDPMKFVNANKKLNYVDQEVQTTDCNELNNSYPSEDDFTQTEAEYFQNMEMVPVTTEVFWGGDDPEVEVEAKDISKLEAAIMILNWLDADTEDHTEETQNKQAGRDDPFITPPLTPFANSGEFDFETGELENSTWNKNEQSWGNFRTWDNTCSRVEELKLELLEMQDEVLAIAAEIRRRDA